MTLIAAITSNLARRAQPAAVLVFAALILVVAFLTLDTPKSIAETIRDPLSLLSSRSPGERASGALYNTKQRKPDFTPTERVLPVTRTRPPEPEWMLPDEPLGYTPFDEPLELGMVPFADFPDLPFAPPALQPPTGPTCCNVTDPGPSTPGVPEPSTWALMILGMFAAGSALRAKVRRQMADQAGSPIPA